jgi:hypothetical protein
MKEETKQIKETLIENSILLGRLLDSSPSGVEKLEMLYQLHQNFMQLDALGLTVSEQSQLSHARSISESYVEKLTSDSMIKKIGGIVDSFLNGS